MVGTFKGRDQYGHQSIFVGQSMLDTSVPNLRHRLRHDLASVHDALDTRISAIDLTTLSGLGRFLCIHHAAYDAVSAAVTDTPSVTERLAQTRAALSTDLGVLGRRPVPVTAAQPPLHPVAVDHILMGSRLGLAVLKKAWSESSDPKVLTVRCFLTLPSLSANWRAHCDRLSGLPGDTPFADRVVEDTRRVFEIFKEAFDANL